MPKLSRRNLLLAGSTAVLAPLTGATSAEETPQRKPFRRCLNLGTLLAFDLPLEEEIDITAKAGYQGCEPWMHRVQQFVEKVGKLDDIRK